MKTSDRLEEESIAEEVHFEIDKDAFKGPFKCCGVTKKTNKKMFIKGIDFDYEVWQCPKCKKEFLDTEQAKRLEKVWTIEKILNEKLISIDRSVNYDGKTFFVRFPIDITRNWHKGSHANIKILSPEEFLVKIKN